MSTNGGKAVPLAAELQDVFFTPGAPRGLLRSRDIFQRNASGRVIRFVTRAGFILTKTLGPAPHSTASRGATIRSTVAPAADLVVHRSGDDAVATFIHDRITSYDGQIFHTKYRSSETWVKRGSTWMMLTLQSLELPTDPPPAAITELPETTLSDYVGTYTAGSRGVLKLSRSGDGLMASINGAAGITLDALVRDLFFTPGAPRTSVVFRRDMKGHVTTCLYGRDGNELSFTKTPS
jgi:hypothetical protein